MNDSEMSDTSETPEDREIRADARDVTATARDVVATDREVVNISHEETIIAGIRMIKWLIVILIVISAGNFFRSFVNEEATEKSTDAAHVAEDAAIRAENASISSFETAQDTLEELRAIIAEAEANDAGQPEVNNQIIVEALRAIARIEAFICGGVCPEPEPE